MSARDDYPRDAPRHHGHLYEQAMDEIDRLRAECQLQRNLLGNATGAALDVGLAGDVTAHDAIYLLAAERDALLSAIIGWQLAIGDELLIEQAENVMIGIASASSDSRTPR